MQRMKNKPELNYEENRTLENVQHSQNKRIEQEHANMRETKLHLGF